MYLIQIFLPLQDNRGRAIARVHFDRLATELTERFGGLTAYARSPADGLWRGRGRRTRHDHIVIYEVMSPRLQRRWWQARRRQLEKTFRQQQLLVRAQLITRL